MAHGPSHATVTVASAMTADLAGHARDLLSRAVPAQLIDDRFDHWPRPGGDPDPRGPDTPATPTGFCAAVAIVEDRAVGYLGGSVGRNRLQLDALIEPGLDRADEVGDALLDALAPALATTPASRLELWGRPAGSWHEALARRHGLEPVRALHQMRGPLPGPTDPVASRPYTPDDLDAVLAVNNRAFVHHPDQGEQTPASLASTMAEPWFRPDGLRIHERDGRVAGFCWTKIHPHPDPGQRLGEIYVIGVDPDFHGQGLGGPMTAAGLHWLHEQGIATGMLYVEADNEPAVRTYRRLGFTIVRTDRAWGRSVPASP